MDGVTLPPSPMQALQADHERLLGRLDDVGGAPCTGTSSLPIEEQSFEMQALIHEARAYIERSKVEAVWIHDARDRSQLRANLRFWASFLVNCTGVYPDTTLRPPRPFYSDYSNPSMTQTVGPGSSGTGVKPTLSGGTVASKESAEPQDQAIGNEAPDGAGELYIERPSWVKRLSRSFGLFAILIVGVIPLAAVCLALSLFYNLDNRSPWGLAGEAATQTAVAVLQLPSSTPLLLYTATPIPAVPNTADTLPFLGAEVSIGKSPSTGCTPSVILSFDAPKVIDSQPIPPVEISIYQAGTETVVAEANLEPGVAPVELSLESTSQATGEQDWLVRANHPWLGVESVILSGALFTDCAQDQITIVYQSTPGSEVWRQASQAGSTSGLDLRWDLLTWGPQALSEDNWVASLALHASGGNGTYVYFAGGDLATPAVSSDLLPEGRLVLEQANCRLALAQVGVTSAGQSYSRALGVQLVTPECH
jgi:hypothetical protein